MLRALKVVRSVGIVLIIMAYALLVHHVNTLGQSSMLGALLALAPLLLITLTFAFRVTSKILGMSIILLFLISSCLALPLIEQRTASIFWLQDIGLMLILLVTFARTLLNGRKALCVDFAELINGGALSIAHERYAYKVTIVWVIFFATMMLVSSLLFFFAPLANWSFFVNFLTLPLVASMFIVEFLVRRQVLTDLPEGSVLDAVRAYLNSKNTH
jgi:uncharacterized membrane protein